jgi:FecR-like protein
MRFTRRRLMQAAAGAAAFGVVGTARAGEDGVGAVNDIINVAWCTIAGAARDELDDEDPVFMQEVIETEDESAVVIVFADGSKLTVGENARLTIDNYVYDPSGGGAAAIKMVKGAFRFVSGTIPKENVKLETPTVTIGIRGTELVFDVAEDGETEMSTVSGEADCTDGSGETLAVAANQSILVGSNRRFRGRVRRFLHRSRSLAVADGLEGARKRWRIRKQKRRRNRRRRRNR